MLKNIMSKVLPPKGKAFFDCFEKSAEICCESTGILSKIMLSDIQNIDVDQINNLKIMSNAIETETLLFLNATHITLIDREDVQLISSTLNKVIKRIIKTILTLKTYQIKEYTSNLDQQIKILSNAVGELRNIIFKFRKFK